MKKFIYRVFFFFGIVVLVMTFNYTFNSYFLNKRHFVSNANTVIIGDSRMMTGLDPSLIDNCINTAQNSESYFISYFKLKYILKYSKNVKKIILGFSYPSLSAYMDNLYKNDFATGDVFNRIYPIISIKDFGFIPVDKERYYTIIFRNMFVLPQKNHEKFIGRFTALPTGMKTANVNTTIQRHYFDAKSKNCGVSEINRDYLDSIIMLIKENKIQMYLVNLPFHQQYLKKIPKNFIDFYNKTKEEVKSTDVHVLDYGNEKLDDSNFKDHVHLSSIGASLLSKRLNQDLK